MSDRKKISDTKRQVVFARDRFTCVYCGRRPKVIELEYRKHRIFLLPVDDNDRAFEIDHIIPYSISHDNSLNNLCTACWSCNHKKSNKQLPSNFPQLRCDIDPE